MKSGDAKQKRREAMDVAACTCANLRKAARAVSQAYDAALQPTGLKTSQFTVLATLTVRGESPLTRLAEVLVMDRTTLSRNLKPLERRDLIRIGHDDDQRVRLVGLTTAGKRLFDHALPHWEQAQARIFKSLGRNRWSALLNDLDAAVATVRER